MTFNTSLVQAKAETGTSLLVIIECSGYGLEWKATMIPEGVMLMCKSWREAMAEKPDAKTIGMHFDEGSVRITVGATYDDANQVIDLFEQAARNAISGNYK